MTVTTSSPISAPASSANFHFPTVSGIPSEILLFENGSSVGFYSDSTFFGLLPGENLISVSATGGAQNAVFETEFTPLYFGA